MSVAAYIARLRCWLSGLWETWEPGMWSLHLSGVSVRVSGHLHGEPRYRIVGDREYEWTRCVRCGLVLEEGWRPMW